MASKRHPKWRSFGVELPAFWAHLRKVPTCVLTAPARWKRMSARSALVGEATFLRSFFRHYFREGFFGLIFASETILCQKVSKKGSEKRPKSAAKLCIFTVFFQKVRTLCQKVRTLGQNGAKGLIMPPFCSHFGSDSTQTYQKM